MIKFKIIKNKIYIYFTVLFLIIIFFKFFESAYIVIINNYDSRLIKNYGYCEKSSYGFIKYIKKKYNLKKNIKIVNEETHPSSQLFLHKPKVDYDNNYLILLNYNDYSSMIDINDYTVIDKFKNCLFLKKND